MAVIVHIRLTHIPFRPLLTYHNSAAMISSSHPQTVESQSHHPYIFSLIAPQLICNSLTPYQLLWLFLYQSFLPELKIFYSHFRNSSISNKTSFSSSTFIFIVNYQQTTKNHRKACLFFIKHPLQCHLTLCLEF